MPVLAAFDRDPFPPPKGQFSSAEESREVARKMDALKFQIRRASDLQVNAELKRA